MDAPEQSPQQRLAHKTRWFLYRRKLKTVAKRGEKIPALRKRGKARASRVGVVVFKQGESVKIVIEKGVPMPPAKQAIDAFGLKQMEISDSFFIEVAKKEEKALRNKISLSATRAGMSVSIRAVDGGIRVWRTK